MDRIGQDIEVMIEECKRCILAYNTLVQAVDNVQKSIETIHEQLQKMDKRLNPTTESVLELNRRSY